MGFVEFLFETRKGKAIMGLIYGMGGAIVIIGALFKIMHWPGASLFLILGLGTEALIFAISAFEPPHFDVDWSLVYPELGGLDSDDLNPELKSTGSPSNELDSMLNNSGIDESLIQNLGDGMKKLTTYTSNLNDITEVSVASEEYTNSLKTASETIHSLSTKYDAVSETLTGLSDSANIGSDTGKSLQKITSTLVELGSAYESQLSGAKDHTEKMNTMFEGINGLVENLSESVEYSEQYKNNISQLSENLATLNKVYGNMVSAMNPNS